MTGDIRDAIRQWTRTPVITVVVVLSLALGIGANTAIFSLIDSLLLRPLPVAQPERLVRDRTRRATTSRAIRSGNTSARRRLSSSESAAVSLMRPDISSSSERRSALGLAVSGSFFETLGVAPAIGRLIAPDDDRPGPGSDVVVLEYEFWQRTYRGGDVLGQTIPLDGRPFTIIGVVRARFLRAQRRPPLRSRHPARGLQDALSGHGGSPERQPHGVRPDRSRTLDRRRHVGVASARRRNCARRCTSPTPIAACKRR